MVADLGSLGGDEGVVVVGVRRDRPCHLHISIRPAPHVDQLDVPVVGRLPPRRDSYNSRSTGGRRRSESMETSRCDPDHGFQGHRGRSDTDGGAVDAPPSIGAPAVEVESGLVGPAWPAAMVDDQSPSGPVLGPEDVYGRAKLLDVPRPPRGAIRCDGGPGA